MSVRRPAGLVPFKLHIPSRLNLFYYLISCQGVGAVNLQPITNNAIYLLYT